MGPQVKDGGVVVAVLLWWDPRMPLSQRGTLFGAAPRSIPVQLWGSLRAFGGAELSMAFSHLSTELSGSLHPMGRPP